MRTLNVSYQRHYAGLGDVSTLYPASAFVTHLLYLKGTMVPVDVEHVTVRPTFNTVFELMTLLTNAIMWICRL